MIIDGIDVWTTNKNQRPNMTDYNSWGGSEEMTSYWRNKMLWRGFENCGMDPLVCATLTAKSVLSCHWEEINGI